MSRRFYALCLLAALGWVPACLHNRAAAQDAEPLWCNAPLEDVHTLAVAAHHEAGDSIADSAAIHRVLRTLAEGRGYSFGVMARRYMPHAFQSLRSDEDDRGVRR